LSQFSRNSLSRAAAAMACARGSSA
jgi:hypothetical protein